MRRIPRTTNFQGTTRCKRLMRSLADYIDGNLPEALSLEIEVHIRKCRTCDCVIDALKKTVSLYRTMPLMGVPPKTRRHLHRYLKKRCLR